jgi:hypothetical protein
MIDIPTLRADDDEEFEVLIVRRRGKIWATLRVHGADMLLVLSQDRFNIVAAAFFNYIKPTENTHPSLPRLHALTREKRRS